MTEETKDKSNQIDLTAEMLAKIGEHIACDMFESLLEEIRKLDCDCGQKDTNIDKHRPDCKYRLTVLLELLGY